MTYHIQFLKTIMMLVVLCLPIGLGVNLSYFISVAIKVRKLSIDYLGMIVSYFVILLFSFLSGVGHPLDTVFDFNAFGILVAIVSGVFCIGIEYLIGVLLNFCSTKRWVLKISVHSVYSDARKIDIWDILAVGVFVVLEEFVFRSAIINILLDLKLSITIIVIIDIIVFSLNHVHWGLFVFIQKLFSGCIFVLLYIMFGYNIIMPIIAHLTQNITLLWMSRRERNE